MLPEEFTLTKRLYEEYKEDYQLANPTLQAVDEYLENRRTGNYWHYDLSESFKDEYNYFLKNDLYFTGSPVARYISFYDERKQEYVKEFSDTLDIDFIIKELNEISKIGFEYCPENLKENIKHSINRQKEFLFEEAIQTNYTIEKIKNRWGEIEYTYRKDLSDIPKESLTDLSDSTFSEKIIYVESLGVIDYLKTRAELGFSIKNIASLLSGITGENPDSIQSAINPINNKQAKQKNNPMKNSKKVSKIHGKIIEKGFKPKE